ncbi:MAG: hypothetical protein ABMA64_22170 [Myxococcota bacterium]
MGGQVTLGELAPEEEVVLVAMVRLVVHADQHLSGPERDSVERLRAELGAERWNAAVQRARAELLGVDVIEHRARDLAPPARRLIWAVLVELAGVDGVARSEAAVLRWVADEWGIEDTQH